MKQHSTRHTTTITAELQERLNRLAPNETGLNAQIRKMVRDLEHHLSRENTKTVLTLDTELARKTAELDAIKWKNK